MIRSLDTPSKRIKLEEIAMPPGFNSISNFKEGAP
jgi:hypothetical protein